MEINAGLPSPSWSVCSLNVMMLPAGEFAVSSDASRISHIDLLLLTKNFAPLFRLLIASSKISQLTLISCRVLTFVVNREIVLLTESILDGTGNNSFYLTKLTNFSLRLLFGSFSGLFINCPNRRPRWLWCRLLKPGLRHRDTAPMTLLNKQHKIYQAEIHAIHQDKTTQANVGQI